MIEIKDISGKTRFSTPINKGAKGKFTLMKEDYIILPFSAPSPIPFKLGDYVDLAGALDESLGGKLAKIYEITDIQKPTYNTSTGGYDYELRLDAYYWKWKNKIFKYTPEQAGSEASWSLTASLDVQLGVFLRNLKSLGYTYRGSDFTFSIDDTVENKAVAMTYDNLNLLDALFSMAGEDKWNCDCWITDNVIHFGRNEFGDAVKIERGIEASSITRSESQGTYATRIYAFGSTKNIPTNYRPTDEQAVVNGVVQKRLMLPADTPYIDAYEGMSQEEAIEDVVVFDDVYPRRVGTLSDVHTRTEEVNNEDGTKETVTYYRYKDTGLVFKDEYIIEGQELKIKFQSGKLNGMEFGVIFNPTPKDETRGEQLWEIVRNDDYGRILPDDIMRPENGDKYVLSGFDIQLVSDQYIPDAEQELKEKAQKYADKVNKDDGTYPTTLRSSWVKEDLVSRTFEFGQRINLVDDTYFESGRISRVLGWEMNLDVPWDSPVYTIGESMPYSRIGEIEDKVDALTYKGQVYTGNGSGSVYVIKVNDSTPPSDSNVLSSLRSIRTFIRKDKEDVTEFLLRLLGGVKIGKHLTLGEFITGMQGGYIDEKGRAELESLVLRSELIVPAIRYNYMTYFEGYNLISPGGGLKVKDFTDNGDGSWTVTPDLEEGQPCGQYVDDILLGYWHDKSASGDFAGFRKVQFRVTEVDYIARTFKMVPRPETTAVPVKEMKLGQTGNFTNENRQTYIIIDTRDGNNCITFYDNANTWDPEPAQMKSWLGKKKGMTVGGIPCDNYSAVLQNILMTGLVFQVDEITGENVRVPIDMGEWDPDREGGYAYYMRVSYPGGLWLCVNPNGTTKEPGEGSVDWLLQVKDGTAGEPGLSIIGGGRWDATKTPYAANTMVSLYNCVFLSNVETSEPPIPIARFKDGSYRRKRDGGYILAGSSSNPELVVHPDWTMLLDGRNLEGTNITFLGSFAKHPNNPLEGQAYYNTTDRCSYLYSGGHWHLLVRDGKDGRDYEYIYTRTNIIDLAPDKPDSKQQDDYVPEGWTDDFLGVDEDHQVEWGCKRNKINGVWSEWSTPAVVHRWAKDGVSAVIADLDNEMVNCRLNTEGKSVEQQNWIVNVSMWYGTEKQTLTALDFEAPQGFVVLADVGKGIVSVTVDKGTSLEVTNNVILKLQATVRGQIVNRDLTFTVAGVRDGENGEDAVLYSLVPSETVIKRYENGAYNVASVSCKRIKTTGSTTVDTTDGVLKYSIDGGDEVEMQNNDEIRTEGISGSVRFAFYVDDKLVDVESVPVVADGQKGEDGSSITSEGHWEASRVPFKTGSIVDFAGSLFVALRETSEPPYPIARFKDGSYRRMRDGAYILAGSSANRQLSADWRLFLEGVEYNVSADLDNEMVNCRLDSDGKAVSGQSWFPQVTMWYGTSRMVLSEIYYNAPAGFTVSADTNTGIVAVSVAAGTSVAEMNEIKVIAIGTRSGKTYSRELTFTVAGVRDGAAAVFYSLLPSVSSIQKDKKGGYSVNTISCKRQKTVGNVLTDTDEGELKYSIDNGGEVAVNDNEAISVNKITQKIQFVFYVNGRIVDRETIPMVTDGLDGTNGQSTVIADMDSEMVSCALTSDGKASQSQNWITNVSIWYGIELLPIASISTTQPTGFTVEADKSTGRVTVSVSEGTSVAEITRIEITVTAQRAGQSYERKLTFTIAGVKAGSAGRGVSSITNYYLASNQSTGVTTTTSGWSTSVQTVSASKKYLWNYEKITYTDGKSVNTTPAILGMYSSDGADGKGISSVTEEYGVSSSQSTQPSSWQSTPPAMSATNKYLWNRETTTYTDSTKKTITHVIAVYGDKGDDAVLYSLLPSVSSVKKNKNGTYSVNSVSCKRQKTVGGTTTDTTDGVLKYSIDGGAEQTANNGQAISASAFTSSIKFLFYIGQTLVDVETIPMLIDGTDGQDGSSVVSIGHWDMSKVPVKANSLVNFAGSTFLALRDTSEPPYPLARFKDGSYRRLRNGGYILAGRSDNRQLSTDWRIIMEAPEVSIVYTLVPAVNVISFTSNGSPSPSSVLVECKQTNGSSMSSCNSLYLVARKYNGSWLAHVGAVQAQSIGVPATAGYSQFAVRAYKTASAANSWSEDYVAQVTIGVATDGSTGDRGPAGAFPYDCGVYKSGTTYVWNESRRDKIIYAFSGIYYVYLVKNFGASVTAAPSNINGDNNWEMAQKFANIATDTLFADGANVAGFMFKNGVMRSQDETNGVANMILNGKTGYFHCVNAEITGKFIGNLTADSGTIGGFSIGPKSLSNLAADVSISIGNYNNSTTKFFSVNRGSGVMLQVQHDNGICINAETYGSTDSIAIKALCNASGYGQAIQAYGNVSLLARNIEKTRINGIVVNTRRITSSATINANDDFLIFGNSGDITVTMPSKSASPAGKILYMKRVSGKGAITLSGSFRNSNNAGGASSLVVNDDVSRFFVRDDLGYWVHFTCG